jgi:hypothetical protein
MPNLAPMAASSPPSISLELPKVIPGDMGEGREEVEKGALPPLSQQPSRFLPICSSGGKGEDRGGVFSSLESSFGCLIPSLSLSVLWL